MTHSLLEQAQQARQQGAWDLALQRLEQALQSDPQDWPVCRELASTYAIRGRLNDSLRAYLRLIDILRSAGDLDAALHIAELILQLRPDHLEARQHRLAIYEQRGQVQEASKTYRELSRLLVDRGQGEQAIELLERGQLAWPQHLEIAAELAEVLLSQGLLSEGRQQLQQVAWGYAQREDWQRACEAYRRMKLITPGDTTLLFELGRLHLRLNRLSEAEQEFRAILRHDLNHQEALKQLGRVCQLKGQGRDAVLAFQRLLHLQPDDQEARQWLASVLISQGLSGEACDQWMLLSQCRLEQGDTAGAIEALQTILGLNPQHSGALSALTNLDAPLLPLTLEVPAAVVEETPAVVPSSPPSGGLKPRPVAPKLPIAKLTKPRLEPLANTRQGLVPPQAESPAKPWLRRSGDSPEAGPDVLGLDFPGEVPDWLLEPGPNQVLPDCPIGDWFEGCEAAPAWLADDLVNGWTHSLPWPPPLTALQLGPWPLRMHLCQSFELPPLSRECDRQQWESLERLRDQLQAVDPGQRLHLSRLALEAEPDNRLIWSERAALMTDLGLTEEAVCELRNALKHHPDSPGLQLQLFQALLWNQQPLEAMAVALELARGYRSQQQWAACRHWSQQVLALEPCQLEALELLAEVESREGYPHLRVAHLARMTRLSLQQSQTGRASQLWLELHQDAFATPELLAELGQMLVRQSDCPLEILQAVSQVYPSGAAGVVARLQLARAWLRNQRQDLCLQLLAGLPAAAANHPEARLLGLEIDIAHERWESVRELARELAPSFCRGQLAPVLESYLAAVPQDLEVRLLRLESLEQVETSAQTLGSEWLAMARYAQEQGEFEVAQHSLQRATLLGQGFGELIEWESQRGINSLSTLQRWWQHQPDAQSGQALLLELLRQQRLEEARELSQHPALQALDPETLWQEGPQQLLLQARLLRSLGRLDRAIEWLQLARKSEPWQVAALKELGLCLAARGSQAFRDLALQQWEKALRLPQATRREQQELAYLIGTSQARSGQLQAALEAFHTCARLGVDYPDVLERIDEIRQALNFV